MVHLDIIHNIHHDVFVMRTTLTLDDDLGSRLKELARSTGRSFKEVVNEAIRRGLSLGDEPPEKPEPFRVEARVRGFRPGIDTGRLNQLYDELELEDAANRAGLTVNEP